MDSAHIDTKIFRQRRFFGVARQIGMPGSDGGRALHQEQCQCDCNYANEVLNAVCHHVATIPLRKNWALF
jgi:hypothetical protein